MRYLIESNLHSWQKNVCIKCFYKTGRHGWMGQSMYGFDGSTQTLSLHLTVYSPCFFSSSTKSSVVHHLSFMLSWLSNCWKRLLSGSPLVQGIDSKQVSRDVFTLKKYIFLLVWSRLKVDFILIL